MITKDRSDVINARIVSALRLLHEVEINVQYEFYNSAMSRMYYACFYASLAAIVAKGYDDVKTHEGAIRIFAKEYILPGIFEAKWSKFFSVMYNHRAEADYDAFEQYTKEDVLEFLPNAQMFVNMIHDFLKRENFLEHESL